MIKVIIVSVVFLLCILGLTDIMYFIFCGFLINKSEDKCIRVTVLEEKSATVVLRYYLFQRKWFGKRFFENIIAVTDNLSEGTVTRCLETVMGSGIILIPSTEIENVIHSVF